jgi:putative FmdB family regulatory protein
LKGEIIMPIYEYSCKECKTKVELLQKMGENKAGIPCPGCGKDTLEKILSVTAPPQMAKAHPGGCDMVNTGNCGGCCGACH